MVYKPKKHIIHKAQKWREMLHSGEVLTLSEIARKEGLSRARVTQIMNLLKLSSDVKEFLASLQDPMEIKRYSERRLRRRLTAK